MNAPHLKARSNKGMKGKQRAMSDEMESGYSAPEGDEELPRGRATEDTTSAHAQKRRPKPSGPNNHELGLRDWSEVLGMAALTGWDQAIIDRAARRCASLFGEGMSLRTMSETAAEKLDDHVAQYVPEKAPLDISDIESDGVVAQPVKRPAWVCPYDDCVRHHDAYEQAWRWREHLRRTHKLSREQVEDIETKYRQIAGDQQDDNVGTDASDDGDGQADDEHAQDKQMVGGVLVDGFLRHVTEGLGRGKDVKVRRVSNSTGRKGSKRRRLEGDELVEAAA